MPASPKPKDALSELFAKAGKNGLMVGTLGEQAEDTKWLDTGNLAINNAFGGGIPLGRSVEMFGPPSCGKTSVTLQTAIELQKVIMAGGDPERGIRADDVILYSDFEQAMDVDYAIMLGLDVNHPSFQFMQPDTLEEGMDLILKAVSTGRVRLVVVDSVAAMVPSAQAEAESIGKSLPAITARLLKTAGQNLNPILRKNNATIVWINHEMEVMALGASRPGMPPATTTPGGKALKYFASVRAQFRQIRNIKGPWTDPLTGEVMEVPLMTDVKLKVVKNKVAPPFREALLRVRFGRGFDNFWTAMQILLANKKAVYGSSRYYFDNAKMGVDAPDWMSVSATGRPNIHGEKALFKAADKHPDWRQQMIDVASEVARTNIAALNLVTPTGFAEDDDEGDEEPEEEEPQELDDLLGSTSAGKRVKI